MASLSVSGLVPMSAAIAGSDVEIAVESMFSMKSATATMSGTMRLESMDATVGQVRQSDWRQRSRIGPDQGNRGLRGSVSLLDQRPVTIRGGSGDLSSCGVPAAIGASGQWAAAVGSPQPGHSDSVPRARHLFLGALLHSVDSR